MLTDIEIARSIEKRNIADIAKEYKIGDIIDVIGNIEINSFNGKDSIQIRLIDIRKA